MKKILPGAIAILLAGSLFACSSDDDGSSTTTTQSTLAAPAFDGSFECTDPTGDQIDANADSEEPVDEPVPGTDLVGASAEIVDDELVVEFTTDGPVTVDDEPRFQVAKGVPQSPATWFELRAYVKDGNWVVERRRLPTEVPEGGIATERIDDLGLPVTVEVDTVRFAVPLGELPPIDGAPTWQFGSVTGTDPEVFDDCNELTADAP